MKGPKTKAATNQRGELLHPPPSSVNDLHSRRAPSFEGANDPFLKGPSTPNGLLPPCVRVDVALFTLSLFFPLKGIATEQNILSGVNSVTDTKAVLSLSLSHFC